MSVTDELVTSAQTYASGFEKGSLPLPPGRKVAIVACMDARLNVYGLLGLSEGDAHVIRNAGGGVTEDVIRSLAISQRLLGTGEIVLIHHTDCGMLTFTDDQFRSDIEDDTGIRPPWAVETFSDLDADVRQSISRVKNSPFIPKRDAVRGFVYDVTTGTLREVVLSGPSDGAAGCRARAAAHACPHRSTATVSAVRPPRFRPLEGRPGPASLRAGPDRPPFARGPARSPRPSENVSDHRTRARHEPHPPAGARGHRHPPAPLAGLELLTALARRILLPRLRRRDGQWFVQLAGEPDSLVDLDAHDSHRRALAARDAGLSTVVIPPSSPLGIEVLPQEQAEGLLAAYHLGALRLPAPFRAWAAAPLAQPDPVELGRRLDEGFVGLALPAGALSDTVGLGRVAPLLDLLGRRGAPLPDAGRVADVDPCRAGAAPRPSRLLRVARGPRAASTGCITRRREPRSRSTPTPRRSPRSGRTASLREAQSSGRAGPATACSNPGRPSAPTTAHMPRSDLLNGRSSSRHHEPP